MNKTNTKIKSKKPRIILLIGVTLLVLAGVGAAVYFGYLAPLTNTVSNESDTPLIVTETYQAKLKQNEDKVTELVASGDEASIAEASKIVDGEVAVANQSGDKRQIVDAGIAKATFLINTDRAQEALDTVLFALLEKYGDNNTYKYEIYGVISWAYRWLDDRAKADEYFNQIPVQGWD